MNTDSTLLDATPHRPLACNGGSTISVAYADQLQSLVDRYPSVFFSCFAYRIDGQPEYAIRFLETLCETFGRSFTAVDVLLTRFTWYPDNRLPDVFWLVPPTRIDVVLLDRRITQLVEKAYQAAMQDPACDNQSNADEREPIFASLVRAPVAKVTTRKEPTPQAVTVAEPPSNARLRRIYDRELVERRLEEESQAHAKDQRHELVRCYKQMRDRGGERVDQPSPPVPTIRDLANRFPNFAEVVELLSGAAALSLLNQSAFRFPPILLLGAPGVGKTHFASELARVAGLDHGVINMETTSAGWVISGMHRGWANASVGKVAELIVRARCSNPIMVVDEVDKASAGKYDALAPLYKLLEEKTASEFEDECLGVPMDAGSINWIVTANSLANVPEPIVSRMTVLNIAPPTAEQLRTIVASIYRDLRETNAWGSHFDETLSEECIDLLTATSPRHVRAWLRQAFGRAAAAGRSNLNPTDLPEAHTGTLHHKASIGFVR